VEASIDCICRLQASACSRTQPEPTHPIKTAKSQVRSLLVLQLSFRSAAHGLPLVRLPSERTLPIKSKRAHRRRHRIPARRSAGEGDARRPGAREGFFLLFPQLLLVRGARGDPQSPRRVRVRGATPPRRPPPTPLVLGLARQLPARGAPAAHKLYSRNSPCRGACRPRRARVGGGSWAPRRAPPRRRGRRGMRAAEAEARARARARRRRRRPSSSTSTTSPPPMATRGGSASASTTPASKARSLFRLPSPATSRLLSSLTASAS
jgi:hypothetical protein